MSGNQPKRLMLMFTIGPVQSFIEAARKTEDLWMGSYILSYLIAKAMDRIRGDHIELIYPAIGNQSAFDFWKQQNFAIPSFPNLFLAIGNGIEVSQNALIELAKDAERTVKTEFERMAECVIDTAFSNKWRGTYVEEVFKRQISDFFDVYWVITQESGQNYGDWYDHTASNLAAIKNCRTFAQIREFGRKCSLDGTREILHLIQDEPVREAMKWWQDFTEREPKYCRREEALCAVSLTKRMGRHFLETQSEFSDEFSRDQLLNFPSTSEIATADFKAQFQSNIGALGIYGDFVKEVKKLRALNNKPADIPIIQPLPKVGMLQGNIDGEWLYEETWSESYLSRYYSIDAKKAKKQIQICKKWRQKLIQCLGEPGRYYAAIALDGDNMGEKIREAKSKEDHEKRSNDLIQYTKDARRIIEQEHLGKLTYAGGDDILALANLKDLLPILKGLREKFPNFTTASAGVCIAHNKVPLGEVLQQARRMEKVAKNEGERNALGITLFKHSGNISQTVTKWTPGDLDVLNISEELLKLLSDNEISKRFLYAFRETFAKLIEDEDDFGELGRHLIQTEFERIMERAHSNKNTEPKESQQTIQALTHLIYHIQPFSHFLGYLEIINFIARIKNETVSPTQ